VVENAQVTHARKELIGRLRLLIVHIDKYAGEELRGADGFFTLKIFDVHGRGAATLVSGSRNRGEYGVTWHGMDDLGAKMPSGIYLCCLQSGSQRVSQKMLMIR